MHAACMVQITKILIGHVDDTYSFNPNSHTRTQANQEGRNARREREVPAGRPGHTFHADMTVRIHDLGQSLTPVVLVDKTTHFILFAL